MHFLRKTYRILTAVLPVMAAAALITYTPAWADDDESGKHASVGRMVVLGDSLSAGFQNFSLYDSSSTPGVPPGGQKFGFATLIANQAGVDLNLPLISYPGLPPALKLLPPGDIVREAYVGSRMNPSVQTLNLSIPSFTVATALAYKVNVSNPAAITNSIDVLALQILASPQSPAPCGAVNFDGVNLTLSEVACAVKLQPNTIIASIGNNDAVQSLIFGLPPTDPGQFTAAYHQFLGALASTGATVVVSNIPDVTVLPFLVPAPAFQALCHYLPPGVTAADYLVPDITSPTFSGNICMSPAVRPGALISQVRSAVQTYNGIIAAEARKFGVTVVDVNGLFARVAQHGYEVNGQRLTTAFLGGLFSLDGVHPTNTGYAIIANEFIKTMNSGLHFGIPPVSVEQVAKTDPLIIWNHAGDDDGHEQE